MSNIQKGLLLLLLTAIAVIGYNIYLKETTPPPKTYSQFLSSLQNDKIKSVELKGGHIRYEDANNQKFSTYSPDISTVLEQLVEKGIDIKAEPGADDNPFGFFKALLPVFLILGAWFLFTRSQSEKSSSMSDKNGSLLIPETGSQVTFEDVAGISEAREELKEVVLFLKEPSKFSRLGGQLPKGVLLQGPPGTGKTLLAKAIAGEASVPFYSMGGSDFVEMFVGVGASRVRELFAEAKNNAPCIVFIDEIDAIGGKRSGGNATGSNDEREQTLNALLVEMDGFSSGETVIVIGATNRPDILDPALLRPGRFDRQVTISLPDFRGRIKILAVHAKKITTSPHLDMAAISRSIPGFSGAEIANLVNEAALLAARNGKQQVDMDDFDEAKDKLIMGLARKNVVITEKERRITAYHEAGHAIVAMLLPKADPVHKITIMPRGRALGLTQQMPVDDRHTYSKEYLLSRIQTLLGGRIAEELIFDQLTTGASNDLAGATEIATRLVCEWGMSDVVGPIAHMQDQSDFLGSSSSTKQHSEQTAIAIDSEIKRIINDCYEETTGLLTENNKFLHKLAEVLMINETVDGEEMDIVFHCYLNEKEMERKLKEKEKDS